MAKLPRKIKKQYKKYKVDYNTNITDFKKHIKRKKYIDLLYPKEISLDVFKQLEE